MFMAHLETYLQITYLSSVINYMSTSAGLLLMLKNLYVNVLFFSGDLQRQII